MKVGGRGKDVGEGWVDGCMGGWVGRMDGLRINKSRLICKQRKMGCGCMDGWMGRRMGEQMKNGG